MENQEQTVGKIQKIREIKNIREKIYNIREKFRRLGKIRKLGKIKKIRETNQNIREM